MNRLNEKFVSFDLFAFDIRKKRVAEQKQQQKHQKQKQNKRNYAKTTKICVDLE